MYCSNRTCIRYCLKIVLNLLQLLDADILHHWRFQRKLSPVENLLRDTLSVDHCWIHRVKSPTPLLELPKDQFDSISDVSISRSLFALRMKMDFLFPHNELAWSTYFFHLRIHVWSVYTRNFTHSGRIRKLNVYFWLSNSSWNQMTYVCSIGMVWTAF